MCGRYQSTSDPATLADYFSVDALTTETFQPRYNVAPSTDVFAIIERDGQRRLGTMRWGFVPPWAKKLGGRGQPINARLETIATNKMFAPAVKRRRCLLPADGFYEWQDRGEGRRKQPYHFADPDGHPLAFAGIWSSWRSADKDLAVTSTAIVTTAASGAITTVHHRMPVLLPAALWSSWLTDDEDEAPHLLDAVAALSPPRLVATPISGRVNAVRNDDPEILTPGSIDD